MSNFMPFISIEVETTGLPDFQGVQLLEIYAIYDDLGLKDIGKRAFHGYVKIARPNWQNDNVKKLKSGVHNTGLKETNRDAMYFKNTEELKNSFESFLKDVFEITKVKTIIAAKNSNSLVLPVLKKFNLFNEDYLDYKTIDVPSLYYLDFGFVPTFQQISKRLGFHDSGFSAEEDAVLINRAVTEKVMKRLGL